LGKDTPKGIPNQKGGRATSKKGNFNALRKGGPSFPGAFIGGRIKWDFKIPGFC